MLGAIIGDIVGSRFEFNPTNDYNFELFSLNAIGQMYIVEKATACTHNHSEGIKGAQSVCTAIHDCLQMHLSCNTIDRDTIYEHGLKRAVERFGYRIDFSLNEVHAH